MLGEASSNLSPFMSWGIHLLLSLDMGAPGSWTTALDWESHYLIPWFSGLQTGIELYNWLSWFSILWHTLASIITWAHFDSTSPYMYLYIYILLVLFLRRTLTDTHTIPPLLILMQLHRKNHYPSHFTWEKRTLKDFSNLHEVYCWTMAGLVLASHSVWFRAWTGSPSVKWDCMQIDLEDTICS